jgi:PAS domain S-box-containing protein
LIKDKIKILHVEDNPNDLYTIQQMLCNNDADFIVLEHADGLNAGLYRLRSESFDLILLELDLFESQGLETLRCFAANAKDTPILVLTGSNDESLGPQAVEEGAQDFLIKENLSRDLLVRAIRYSVEGWRSERKIRESEAHYRRIVETSNEGIWQMNKDFHTIFVNQKMANMLGYLPGEMLGRPVTDFMIEGDLPDHQAKMSERASGLEGKYERRFRRKDGKLCWTLVSSTALKDDWGRFAGSFGMFADISKRKQAEQALQRERDFAEGIIETAQAIVLVLDARGCIVRFNKFMEDISGYQLDEVRGKDWFSAFLPERD